MGDPLDSRSSRRRRSGSSSRSSSSEAGTSPLHVAALAIFALIVTSGPLAFGAVDRVVQIALTGLLGLGMLLVPPRAPGLPFWLTRLLIALAAILVLKELLPASWFGQVLWRPTLVQSYDLALPATHHPELGRAVDGWLAALVGLGWLAWVRTLGMERDDRTRMAWIMFVGAVIIAVISLATAKLSTTMIFGLRPTAGWLGFGPFPNRNHTACFFAMAIVIGAGCLARAGERKRFALVVVAALFLVGLLVALLRTQSRGGLLALGAGLAVFLGVVLLRLRSRQALAVSIACALLVGGLALLAGGKTLQRFAGTGLPSDDSAATRVAVWHNAVGMWRDAPLFGHGWGSFASVFPMYQQISMEEVMVKHPESSWLQWLTELGFIPVVMIVIAGLVFAAPHLGALFERQPSFFVRAAGFGVVATILAHSFFDVPAHRWGTAGFALAAFALACPSRSESRSRSSRAIGLIPLGVAGFWLLPLKFEWPMWSTFQLDRLLAAEAVPPGLPLRELDDALRCFPLNAQLHLSRGERLLRTGALPPTRWQHEFRLAVRLVPNSWQICARVARQCRTAQPSLALHYWQMAVERATRQRVEVFSMSLQETAGLPGADAVWSSYGEANADLGLLLGERLPGDEGRRYYDHWWEQRGSVLNQVPDAESATFLRLAPRWGTPEQLLTWMQRHPERLETDYRQWVALLNGWHEEEKAWGILQREIKEPEFPPASTRLQRADLDFRWRHTPDDIVNARNYAQLLAQAGDTEASNQVILAVAQRPDGPKWFLEKAAFVLARERRFGEAVQIALRVPKTLPADAAASTPTPAPR